MSHLFANLPKFLVIKRTMSDHRQLDVFEWQEEFWFGRVVRKPEVARHMRRTGKALVVVNWNVGE